MKNILLLVHDDAGEEARLQVALDLTRAFSGHLECLDVIEFPVMAGLFTPNGQVILLEDEQQRETENATLLRKRLAAEDVSWSMTEGTGPLGETITRSAGLADIIVTSCRLSDPSQPNMLRAAETIALESHKPFVAVPQTCPGFDVSGPALVAWDGSIPAMAALTGAVPLLRMASTVTLLEIQTDAPSSAAEAAAYLSRHGIHAEVELVAMFHDDRRGIAHTIRQICTQHRSAYCVMGAYGHSPLRERLLGGITRQMLSDTTVPLVLAH